MTNKILSYLSFGVTVLVLILVGVLVFSSPIPKNLGAEGDTNFTNLVLSGYETITGALTVTGAVTNNGNTFVTGITNSSGTSIGSGTNLTKATCGTNAIPVGAIASLGTTTVDVSVAGATSSQNQVYFAGVASSTAGKLTVTANATATTGVVSLWILNNGVSWAGTATTTFSACYIQF